MNGLGRRLFRMIAYIVLLGTLVSVANADQYIDQRRELVEQVRRDFQMIGVERAGPEMDPQVVAAMAKVPRHEFVPKIGRKQAYLNRPLPIGYGQTISQPYIVALMSDLLDVDKDDVVLEIGTGSGYQAAVLSELVAEVYTIEIIEPLGNQSRELLARLGYDNVTTRIRDGYYGWEEHAPFDAIIVTAAASHIPPPLVAQLKPGGKMVIPVGSGFLTQYLVMVEKDDQGTVRTRQLLPVRFVPLTGKH